MTVMGRVLGEFRDLARWAFLGETGGVGTWKIYAKAKRHIGRGELTLSAGVFRLSLHKPAASTNIKVLSTRDLFSSVGTELGAGNGYTAGGKSCPTAIWTVGASAKQLKFSYASAGVVFSATGGNLTSIQYALIHKSVGAVTSGQVLCYCTLSTGAFDITSGNTLTILAASAGVFTLA